MQPTTAKTAAQRLAGVWPRSSLVFQPSVGLGRTIYTRIEMQVWVDDKHFAQAQTVPDAIFKEHGENLLGNMVADIARSIFANQK